MKYFSALGALLLVLASTPALAAEVVRTFWSPTDVHALVTGEPADSAQAGLQGIGFPLLVVFAADGSLAWHGAPDAFDPASLGQSAPAGVGKLPSVLAQMDVAAQLLAPEAASKPSEWAQPGTPTAVLVVLSAEPGICAPCDRSMARLDSLPAEWNRFAAALTGTW